MSDLAALQRRFQRGVLGTDDAVLDDLAGAAPGASRRERLDVYANAVRLRFREVLRGDYPGVHALLGDVDFDALALEYLHERPSRHPSIRWYGAGLAAHLAGPRWRARPQLAEMARFEWTKGELHDAADSAVVGAAQMAAVPAHAWAALRPRPVPAVRRLDLEWNVPGVWVAAAAGEALPALARAPVAQPWLLWRQDLQIRWRSMDPHEAWAFDACAGGATFGALCAGLAGRVGEDAAPMRAAGALKQWLTDGLIAAV